MGQDSNQDRKTKEQKQGLMKWDIDNTRHQKIIPRANDNRMVHVNNKSDKTIAENNPKTKNNPSSIRISLAKTSSKVKEVLRKQSKLATIYLTFPFFSFILSLPHEILQQPLPGQSNV